jgi:hypothetical protein
MARRKRRHTKKSRSQYPAARRRLTQGDRVRVKDEVGSDTVWAAPPIRPNPNTCAMSRKVVVNLFQSKEL